MKGMDVHKRLAVQKRRRARLNIVYFGAAAMVRHDRLQSSPLGPDREVVDYRERYEDPLNEGAVRCRSRATRGWRVHPPMVPRKSDWGASRYSGYLSRG